MTVTDRHLHINDDSSVTAISNLSCPAIYFDFQYEDAGPSVDATSERAGHVRWMSLGKSKVRDEEREAAGAFQA